MKNGEDKAKDALKENTKIGKPRVDEKVALGEHQEQDENSVDQIENEQQMLGTKKAKTTIQIVESASDWWSKRIVSLYEATKRGLHAQMVKLGTKLRKRRGGHSKKV